jgi:hypothetical protein
VRIKEAEVVPVVAGAVTIEAIETAIEAAVAAAVLAAIDATNAINSIV